MLLRFINRSAPGGVYASGSMGIEELLLLQVTNYKKAKDLLLPLSSSHSKEGFYNKEQKMTIDPWVVELHGSLYSGLSPRIDRELDDVSIDTYNRGNVRSWMNDKVQVFELAVENDVFYVFTHILQHFFKGGIGLRQICDWCRLLWSYRETLDVDLLERRLGRAGLMSEWRAFGAFAVEYLGMETTAMPMYDAAPKWKRKAKWIKDFIMMSGNFGHNRDQSYYQKYPYLVRKCISFGRRVGDLSHHARIFPLDSLRFFPNMLLNGLRSAARGE